MSVAGFLVFLVLTLGLLGAINLHVFRWARNAWALGERGRRNLRGVLVASIAAMVLGRVAGRFWPGPVTAGVIATGSTLQLAVIISGALLLLVDVALLLASLPGRVRRWRHPAPADHRPAASSREAAPAPAPELSRRSFVQATAGSAFLVGGGSSLYGAVHGRLDYSLEEVAIAVPGLARALDGFAIAQLSDVHVGAFVGDSELRAAEALLRRAKPDLIVLTGDLLDNDPRLADELGRFVRRLMPLARHGVVAVSGNHDYFAGVEDVAAAVQKAGARMLRNDAMLVGGGRAGFALLGVDDVWARREGGGPDLARAVRVAERLGVAEAPRVLLCHNPSFFAESAGQVALQLSGHTHGGQINLGVRPADYVLPGGWVAGRYDERGSALYVNRGFGTVGPPARLGSPPEVTRVVLTA